MRYRSVGALLGLRLILVANTILLTIVGALCLVSYERPAAYVFAGLVWLGAGVLASFVRFTDPYRRSRPRGHRATSA